jgi:uncharacterized damage-inducible protein DinB
MNEVERILDLYDRAMNGDAWHGDPLWKILEDISAEQAARRVDPHTHTIWELVSHMMFWETEVCRRLNRLAARPPDELNFPAMPEAKAENWGHALAEFRRSNGDLRTALTQLDASRLDQSLPGRDNSIYVEVQGVIQHNVYHGGQIAILRKMLAA